jgi:hypothetical protein
MPMVHLANVLIRLVQLGLWLILFVTAVNVVTDPAALGGWFARFIEAAGLGTI